MRRSEGSLVRGRLLGHFTQKQKRRWRVGGAAGVLSVLGVDSLFCHYVIMKQNISTCLHLATLVLSLGVRPGADFCLLDLGQH